MLPCNKYDPISYFGRTETSVNHFLPSSERGASDALILMFRVRFEGRV